MKRTVGAAAGWLLSCSLLALASHPAAAQAPVGAAPAAGASPSTGAVPSPQNAPANQAKPGEPAKAADTAAAAPAAPTTWAGGIKFTAQFEGGAVVTPVNPSDGLNFGQLFTDRSNQFVLNQALLTLQRPIDPKSTDYDFGFKLQGLYGTDARYVQFLGELNSSFASKYQLAFVEANVAAHLPLLFGGGIDVKVGQFATPLGFETIDPSTNAFYSKSYIFNYGLPFVSFGGLGVAHVTPFLDVYFGADTGSNTTFGAGDENGAAAGTAGLGFTFLDGNLTLLALTHFGPENPTKTVPGANGSFRYFNDTVLTYKATDKLSLTTEVNLIRDDAFGANAYGAAQYVSYALNDHVALNARAEVYRDDSGFFVAGFRGYHDFANFQLGNPVAGVVAVGPATYGEATLGLTWKPTLPAAVSDYTTGLMIRPEVRYDRTLTTTNAYNNRSDRGVFTFAADFVLGF